MDGDRVVKWLMWFVAILPLAWVAILYDMSDMVEVGREPIRVTSVIHNGETGAVTYYQRADGSREGMCGAMRSAQWLVVYRGRLGWSHCILK